MMTLAVEEKTISVVLVEDHQMFREWLAQMLSKIGSFAVAGETDNIRDGLSLIMKQQPDIAIVDITLRGGSSGLELVKDLKAQGVSVPVLVLSMHEEALYAERVLRAGAKGYITKHEASSTLAKAIHTVLDGQVYLSEKMTASMLDKMSKGGARASSSGMELLTDRELEVFQLVGKGYNAREISEQLHLGETTVDTYRTRIKEKLHLRNAAELYSRAAQWVQEHGA
jgi:DNA-binding NarL/FixJ family response regulator